MKRKEFLKRSAALSALSISSPLILTANKIKEKSTYEQLMDQVGFNHIPNTEIKTMNSVLHKSDTRGHADHGWL